MLYVFILAFALLLAANHMLARSALYPPTLFSAVWLITLAGLAVSGDTFYPLSTETLMVFFVGAIAFSAGGLLFARRDDGVRLTIDADLRMRVRRVLDVFLAVAIIGLPFYWQSISGSADLDSSFLAAQRDAAVDAAYASERSFGLFGNLIMLSTFVAIAMHVENDGTWQRRSRAYLAIVLALVFVSLTGSKAGLRLILALMFISAVREGFSVWALAKTTALFTVLFAAGLWAVNFAYLDFDLTPEMAQLLASTIENYWLGSLGAFEQIVRDPNFIPSHHHLGRFFLETANGLGARFDVPSIHAPFTATAMYLESNTYTIYYSYFKDFGWTGAIVGMASLGAFCTWVYNRARRGHPIALSFYGMLALGIALSIQAEQFVLALNGHLKLLIFLWLVYGVLPRPLFGARAPQPQATLP